MRRVSRCHCVLALVLVNSLAGLAVETSRADSAGSTTAPAGDAALHPDLSTPAKAAAALAAAMRADDPAALRAITTDGSDADFRVLQSWARFMRSAGALRRAGEAKFGKGTTLINVGGAIESLEDESALEVTSDGDTASVLANPGSGGAAPSYIFKRNAGQWKLDVDRFPGKAQWSQAAASTRAMSVVMDRIAREIADARYARPQDATVALVQAFTDILQPAAGLRSLARQAPSTRPAAESAPRLAVAGYDPQKVDAHRQEYDWSCIPMSIELVLKLTTREPADYFGLQDLWKDKKDGNLVDFTGRTIAGVSFHQEFTDPRGDDFPIEKLFKRIDSELDQGRYVIVSLYTGFSYHMYVIVGRTESDDYHAVSKASKQTITVTNVKARVRELKGTDILTYTIEDPKNASDRAAHEAAVRQ